MSETYFSRRMLRVRAAQGTATSYFPYRNSHHCRCCSASHDVHYVRCRSRSLPRIKHKVCQGHLLLHCLCCYCYNQVKCYRCCYYTFDIVATSLQICHKNIQGRNCTRTGRKHLFMLTNDHIISSFLIFSLIISYPIPLYYILSFLIILCSIKCSLIE